MKVVSDVGKLIWTKDKTMNGRVTHEINRYCAVCRKTHKCYIVKWSDGRCTKPCEKSVSDLNESELIVK